MLPFRWLFLLVFTGSLFSQNIQVASADDTPNTPKKLLIVAPKSVHSALKPFVEHKQKLLPTELAALESILLDNKGTDDAEKLKRYLFNRWKEDKIGYVLLVGDAEIIPVRYYTVMDAGKSAVVCHLPSDLYYSDLAKKDGSFENWKGSKDVAPGYFARLQMNPKNENEPVNLDEIDYLPEVAVGRWPVHTLAHLEAVIAKTIRYENHVLSDDLPAIRRTAFILGPNATDTRPDMENWGKKLEAISTWRPVRRYARYEGRDYQVPAPTEDEVAKILESGVGMIFHDGHGGWDCWDCLNINHLKTLKDARLPPVMFSLGCSTATYAPNITEMPYIDVHGKPHKGTLNKEVFGPNVPAPFNYQKGAFNPTSFGVEWVRASQNGCVAYIGAANVAAGRNNILIDGYVDYIVASREPLLGNAWTAGIARYYKSLELATIKANDWGRVADFHQGMLFHLFGDPSMRLPRSPNPKANILVNGSFEDGPDVDAYLPLDPGSTAIKGWKVTRGQIDVFAHCTAADGQRCLDLHGSPGFGGIEQAFDTKIGERYRVTFSLAGNPWSDANKVKRMVVSAAGKTQEFTCDSTRSTKQKPGWQTKEWEFVAIEGKTTLEFSTLEKKDEYNGPLLDNVLVVAVPGKK